MVMCCGCTWLFTSHCYIILPSQLVPLWQICDPNGAQKWYDCMMAIVASSLEEGVSLQEAPHFLFSLICSFSVWHRNCSLCTWVKIWRNSFVLYCTTKKKKKKSMMGNGNNWFRFFTGKNIPEMFLSNASISICSSTIFSKLAMWY